MNELIARMASDISSMSLAEKMTGGLVVTVFSMAIVTIVLVIIMYAIKLMTTSLSDRPKKIKESEVKISHNEETAQSAYTSGGSIINKDEEIAAVMAAISAYYASGDTKIVIKNIARNQMSSWANAGMLDQLNSRL